MTNTISASKPGQTIIDLKKGFLSAQIRLLTAPLQPPPADWQEQLPEPEQGDLREGTVREVLHKVNVILRHHSRSTYPSQTTRNVAEQIDAMYWASAEQRVGRGGEDDDDDEEAMALRGLRKGVDLRADENISLLPETWPERFIFGPADADDEEDDEEDEEEGEQSNEALIEKSARLSSLSAQRRAARQRLRQYKHVRRLLVPLEKAGEEEGVLLASADKDGELVGEMKRMRELVGRVEGVIQKKRG
ncbi:MAG: hypothetical protein M1816_007749 [Peltula sp. TS41687]|nr:MAG: hypothetical protein M1816_007749 [Peltula sp. TS41687]